MRVNIKKTTDLLSEDLSIIQRGILITILLLRDSDSEVTLFKVKKNIKLQSYKEDLISLHDKGYITWSGYNAAKKSLEQKIINPKITHLMQFMGDLYRKKFQIADSRITLLTALLKKYSEEDIKLVIANRYLVWKDSEEMKKYLVPETVFRMSKFIKYLEEVQSTREGESLLKASEIDLKNGDEITYEISLSFIDKEVYEFKYYDLNPNGDRVGLPTKESRYGRDIKRLLKIQKNSGEKSFVLIYISK